MWKIVEIALGLTLEQMIDFSNLTWKKKPCKDKRKYFSESAIMEAAKEKKKEKNNGDNK